MTDLTDYAHIHQPVLLRDCVELVSPALAAPGSIAVDCTLGLAGHAIAFLKANPEARLIGIDRDAEALAMAGARIASEGLADRFTPVHAAFDALRACRSTNASAASPIPMTRRSTCAWT